MSTSATTIQECGDTLFAANNELLAITELLNTQNQAELRMTEHGRNGLAAILDRICSRIAEATCNLPTGAELTQKINELAMEWAASIAVNRMSKNCGKTEASHE